MIEASSISVGYGSRDVLTDISLTVSSASITALIGPNGCGKSTLLKSLAGLHQVHEGEVRLKDRPIGQWSRKSIAREIAFLAQSPEAPDGVTVAQLVEHGGFARSGMFRGVDRASILDALEMTGMKDYADRPFRALSGGERQRAWIALTLFQEAEMLLLDEPTSYLDMGHQVEILDLLMNLKNDQGIGIVMVLHDINQASQYADRIIALKDGTVQADGTPKEIISAELVQRLYGAQVSILPDPTGCRPFCVPRGRVSGQSTRPVATSAV